MTVRFAVFAIELVIIFCYVISVSNFISGSSRMSAVAYLASYLSRGKFLSTSLVINTLKRLLLKIEIWKEDDEEFILNAVVVCLNLVLGWWTGVWIIA